MIDAGSGIKPRELRDVAFAHALLDLLKISDPGVRALRVVRHVFQDDELAAMGLEGAQIRIGRIHQLRHLAQASLEILRPVFAHIEVRIPRVNMLDGAGAEHPGYPVRRLRRQGGRRGADPPGTPPAGGPIGLRRLSGDAPTWIFGHMSSAGYYCSGGSPLVRFLARSIMVTAIRISARVLRSGASSIACFSGGP